MEWRNIGDIHPECGTTVVKNPRIRENGDFHVNAIHIQPERHVGGNDRVFMISDGEFVLARQDFESALEGSGSRIEGKNIILLEPTGDTKCVALDSRKGLLEFCEAANNHCALVDRDSPDRTSYFAGERVLVQIGLPQHDDPDPEFRAFDTTRFYPNDTSLWAILRDLCAKFNDRPEENPRTAVPLDTSVTGPFHGLTRDMRVRRDLCVIQGFQDLEKDKYGGPAVHAEDGTWIGPKEPELVALWQDFPDENPDYDPEHESGLNDGP